MIRLRPAIGRALLPAVPLFAAPVLGQTPTGCLVHSPAPSRTDVAYADGLGSVAYQQFPTAWAGDPEPDPKTAWFVSFDHASGQALFMAGAWFRRGPGEAFTKVLDRTGPSELFTRYQNGTTFRELGSHSYDLTQANGRDIGRCGRIVGIGGKAVREVVDKGVLWKNDARVVRGQMMVLWGTLDASNHNYIVRYEFHDDGTFKARVAATGRNYPVDPTMAHTHSALWRIDADLGDAGDDSVWVVRHEEDPDAGTWSDTTTAFNRGKEGSADFTPVEFSQIRIADAEDAWEVRPLWRGVARHPELWLRNDFWATVAKSGETDFTQLAAYTADEEEVSGPTSWSGTSRRRYTCHGARTAPR